MKITSELILQAQDWLESDEFKKHFDNKEFASGVRALAVSASTQAAADKDPQVKLVGTAVLMGFGLGYLARKGQDNESTSE